MKKIFLFITILLSAGAMAQSPTVDSLKFMDSRGKLWEAINYSTDSILINGIMLRSGSYTETTNYWQPSGASIKPNPDTKYLQVPAMATLPNPYPVGSAPVWWNSSNYLFYKYIQGAGLPDNGDTITGCNGLFLNETEAADVVINVDSIANICGCFMVKNIGLNSTLTVQSIEGLLFDASPNTASTTITLSYGEWVSICPATTKFITMSADTVEAQPRTDSIYRYSAYSSGNINVEVSASGEGITATRSGGSITFVIPAGIKLLSAKARVEGYASIVFNMGTADMANSAMADRWMPLIQAWREDTGQQLMGVTCLMDLTNYDRFTVNGLISSTKCQIRLGF